MDIDPLERLWRSASNDPTPEVQANLMEMTMTTLRNRRNGFHLITGLIGVALSTATLVFGYNAIKRETFDPAREWGAVLALVICWVALAIIRTQYRRHERAFPNANAAFPDALAALIDENRTEQNRLKVMAFMLVFSVAAITISLSQLYSTGKMAPAHVAQFALLAGGALGISVLINGLRYMWVVQPEGRRLRRLLTEAE